MNFLKTFGVLSLSCIFTAHVLSMDALPTETDGDISTTVTSTPPKLQTLALEASHSGIIAAMDDRQLWNEAVVTKIDKLEATQVRLLIDKLYHEYPEWQTECMFRDTLPQKLVSFSANGQRIITGSDTLRYIDEVVKEWSINDEKLPPEKKLHNDGWFSQTRSVKCGSTTATIEDKNIIISKTKLPHAKTKRPRAQTITTPNNHFIEAIDLSYDGSQLVSIFRQFNHQIAYLYNLEDGVAPHSFSDAPVTVAQFLPREHKLLAIINGTLPKIFDSRTCKVLHELTNDLPITSVTISPDGSQIALVLDNTVKIWIPHEKICIDLASGPVVSVQFSPHEPLLLTRGPASHPSANLWHTRTGTRVCDFEGHQNNAIFSPDGSRIATTTSRDGTIRIWSPTLFLAPEDVRLSGQQAALLSLVLQAKLHNDALAHQGQLAPRALAHLQPLWQMLSENAQLRLVQKYRTFDIRRAVNP